MAEAKKKNTLQEDLDFAFAIIEDATKRGDKLTDEQRDTMIRAMLDVIPEHERSWFTEIAEQNTCPLWMVLWAQWRRSQENGLAPALLLDIDWEASLGR